MNQANTNKKQNMITTKRATLTQYYKQV